ncbi:MAG: hypothetical protein GC190_15540 [Alphaproteobacteria bacterium]|nr:hypothetical protein [Alphaproteobacteria bacterium]
MRTVLFLVLVTIFALGSAVPALADRGDRWRDRQEQHRERDQGDHYRRDGGSHDYQPGARERATDDGHYDNRHRKRHRPWSNRRREHDRARDGVIRGRMIPLEDLENRIARRAPGYRIGNPEFMMFGDRPVYRIRWRTPDGHILVVFADAETGQIIDIRGR